MKNKRYKVSNMEGSISMHVDATNQFDALEKVRKLTDSDEFRVVEIVVTQGGESERDAGAAQ